MLSLTLHLVFMYVQSCLASFTSFGDERAGLYASRVFVCLYCMLSFFVFALALGVRGWTFHSTVCTLTFHVFFYIFQCQTFQLSLYMFEYVYT